MKTKNKKILALLCLPVLVMTMILPLCSFTTLYEPTDGYKVYSSIGNICLPYYYEYGSSGTYFGMINECSRCLVDANATTRAAMQESIKYTASDYYITGSSRIRVLNPSSLLEFSNDFFVVNNDLSSNELMPYTLTTLYRTNNTNTYFGNEFYVENYSLLDGLKYYFYIGDELIDFLDDGAFNYEVEVDGYINYWVRMEDQNQDFFANRHFTMTSVYRNSNTLYASADDCIKAAIAEWTGYSVDEMLYYTIPSVKITIKPWEYLISEEGDFDVYYYDRFDGIVITSNVTDTYDDDFLRALQVGLGEDSFYWLGYNQGYNEGYSKGLNAGISSAPTVWKDLGTFLTSTVGSFLNAPLFPGFSVSVILTVFVGAVLLIAFLKLFAGG